MLTRKRRVPTNTLTRTLILLSSPADQDPKREEGLSKQVDLREESPGVIKRGRDEESIEDVLDIEEDEEEAEEVAWVPRKEEPKPVVVDSHAGPQVVDLREEIFECNYTNSRCDFCTMKGDVQVSRHSGRAGPESSLFAPPLQKLGTGSG
jgi:hypothetical protein